MVRRWNKAVCYHLILILCKLLHYGEHPLDAKADANSRDMLSAEHAHKIVVAATRCNRTNLKIEKKKTWVKNCSMPGRRTMTERGRGMKLADQTRHQIDESDEEKKKGFNGL